MTIRTTLKAVSAAAAIVAVSLPGIARADAIAQSILNITDFHFYAGDAAAGGTNGLNLGTDFIIVAAPSVTAGATADLNGTFNGGAAIAGGKEAKLGNFGSYVAGTRILSPAGPADTFVASTSTQGGDATTGGGANAHTNALVELKPTGDGSADSNVNLQVQFSILAVTGKQLQVSFDADSFLRAYLAGGSGLATAATAWSLTVTHRVGAATVTDFSWSPDGAGGGISGGAEYSDPFSLAGTVSAQISGDDNQVDQAKKSFEAETTGLTSGITYQVSIRQNSNADAELIPEPGSIALVGVALAGLGFASRRRRASK